MTLSWRIRSRRCCITRAAARAHFWMRRAPGASKYRHWRCRNAAFRRPLPRSCATPARPRSRRRPQPDENALFEALGRALRPRLALIRRPEFWLGSRHLTVKGTAAMVDDRPEEHWIAARSERPKRAPPTIDLEATEVSSATAAVRARDAPMRACARSSLRRRRSPSRRRAGFALDRCAGLRRGCGCAGDRRRLDAGLARDSAGHAGRAAAQRCRHRRSHRAHRRA